MTTYLATTTATKDGWAFENITLAYCSRICREVGAESGGWNGTGRDDDSYEFDEVCANCGVVIPACEPWRNLAAALKAEGWPK
jgi:hypothetical protein